ncbi:fasciclin domain protein [Synechococcus sp. PCC 7335]|uniref:fasciclin domain-containing protein n=1 Tax=Synechococcus sp. (strain ATCC 29403 / PCC 7335) TaxID=91464 RepID=UPI00017EE81C|nr:fasciclin domain-containing protein [Synechococcus sp. PCC 7335]EDX83182.1 fasciclin domain protein [Synechococcus sp. PCC 7335]
MIKFSRIKLLAIAGAISFGVVPAVDARAQVLEANPTTKQTTDDVVTESDIATIVSDVEGLSTLEAALEAADLTDALMGEGPFTVIAPVNDAFATLPDGVLEFLLLPENKDLLTDILTYHVIPGEVMYADLEPGTVETLNGEELTITVEDDLAFVDGIQIVGSDVAATNGLVHIVQDGVLVPADTAAELDSRLEAAMDEETMDEETTVEEPIDEEPTIEEPTVEEPMVEETAPAEPVRGLW